MGSAAIVSVHATHKCPQEVPCSRSGILGSPERIPMIQAPFNISCDSVALQYEAGKKFSMEQFPSYVLLKIDISP